MDERDWLADRFEANRTHLRAVAYRMLGSVAEADDAVQEAWLRLNRSGGDDIRNLSAWLTTVVGHVCLDMLRSRAARREEPLGQGLPEPIVTAADGAGDPEHQALLADTVGLALLVVLDRLTPAERLAFVLHDMFNVPFDDIAPIVDRSPAAARQLASRARRRVRGAAPAPDADLARQREVVDAFLAAARGGDFERLVTLLHPDVVVHIDRGAVRTELRGVDEVVAQARRGGRLAALARPVLVNGAPGMLIAREGRPLALVAFTVADGRIVEVDVLADRARLAHLAG